MRYSIRCGLVAAATVASLVLSSSFANAQGQPASSRSSSSKGHGTVFLDLTFAPVMKSDNSGMENGDGARSKNINLNATSGSDLRGTLGFFLGEHILVGATYNSYSDSVKRDATTDYNSSEQHTTKTEYGPTLGFVNGGFRLVGTYFMSGTKKYTYKAYDSANAVQNDSNYEDTNATGFQVTLGYSWILSSWFEIGPSLVYRTMNYSKQSYTNAQDATQNYKDASLQTKAQESSLSPMISTIFIF